MKKVMKTLLVVLTLCLAFVCVGSLNAKATVDPITKDDLVSYHNNTIKPLIESVDNDKTKYVSYTMKAEYDDYMLAYNALLADDKAYVDEKTDNFKWVVELGVRLTKVENAVKAAVNNIKGYNLCAAQDYTNLKANLILAKKDLASIYAYFERLTENEEAEVEAIKAIAGDDPAYTFENAWKDYKDAGEHLAAADNEIDAYEAKVEALYNKLYDATVKKLDNYKANETEINQMDADYGTLNDATAGTPNFVNNLCAGVAAEIVAKKDELVNGLKKSNDLAAAVGNAVSALNGAINANQLDVTAAGTKADGIYAANVKEKLTALEAALAELKAWDTSAYNNQTLAQDLAKNTKAAYDAQQKEVDDLANYFVNDLDTDKIVGAYPATQAIYNALCPNQQAAFNAKEYAKEVGDGKDLLPYSGCAYEKVNNLGEYKAYLDGLYTYAKNTADAYEAEINALNYKFTYAYYKTLVDLNTRLGAEPKCVTNAITSKAFVAEDLAKIDTEVKKAADWKVAVDYTYADDYEFGYDDLAKIKPSYDAFNALSDACQAFLHDNADAKDTDLYNAEYLAYAKYAKAEEVYETIAAIEKEANAAVAKLAADGKLVVPTDLQQFVDDFAAAKAAVAKFAKGTTEEHNYPYDLTKAVDKIVDYKVYLDAEKAVPGYQWCLDVDALYADAVTTEEGDNLNKALDDACNLKYKDLAAITALEKAKDDLADEAKAVIAEFYETKLAVAKFNALNDAFEVEGKYALEVANLLGEYGYDELAKCFVDDFGTDDYDWETGINIIKQVLKNTIAESGVSTPEDLTNALIGAYNCDYNFRLNAYVNEEAIKLTYIALIDASKYITDFDKIDEELTVENCVYNCKDPLVFIGYLYCIKGFYGYELVEDIEVFDKYLTSATLIPGSEIKSATYDYDTLPFITIKIADVKAYESAAIKAVEDGEDAALAQKGINKFQQIKDFCSYLAERLNSDIENFIDDYETGKMEDLTLEQLKERYVIPATKIENTILELDGAEDVVDTQAWYVLRVAKFREIEDLVMWKYFYATAATNLAEGAKAGYFTVEGYTELYDLKALYRQADEIYQNLVAEYFNTLHNEITPLYEEQLAAKTLQNYDDLRDELTAKIETAQKELEEACEECKKELQNEIDALEQRLTENEQAYTKLSNALDAEKAAREAAQLQCTEAIAAANKEINANKTAITTETAAREAADATEKAAREAADATEKAAREAADAAEEKARKEADNAEVEARKAAVLAEETARKAADVAEEAARKAADDSITADVKAADEAEKAAREAADAAEKTAREAADAAEEEARKAAIANEESARKAADAAEEEARIAADEALTKKVNTATVILAIVSGLALVGVIVLFIIKK